MKLLTNLYNYVKVRVVKLFKSRNEYALYLLLMARQQFLNNKTKYETEVAKREAEVKRIVNEGDMYRVEAEKSRKALMDINKLLGE
tara:strand:- start:22679 stop:22936 length:258 start_codon:yes stop_codon:yes gene_type:complete